MVPETLKESCITTRFRGKAFFAPKIGEMGQKLSKIGFFEFKENLVINFHCIYSILILYLFHIYSIFLFAVFLHKSFGKNLVPEI